MRTILELDQDTSSVFEVPPGHQVTLQAQGLSTNDRVVVETVYITNAGAALDWCCANGAVSPAEVAAAQQLRCANGARVILTEHYPFVVLSGPVRVPLRARFIPGDPSGAARVQLHEYPAGAGGCGCECHEPYTASYPLDHGGFGFLPGDMRDPEATVEAMPCGGTGPLLYLYPTPRPGASAPQYDCAGVVQGYGMNTSPTAMVVPTRVPCAT